MIDGVCVKIGFVPDSSRGTYMWQFAEGCFEGGAIAHYSPAKPETLYDFSSLLIEVRQTDSTPDVVVDTVPQQADVELAE